MTHGDSMQRGPATPAPPRPLLVASVLCWLCVLFSALTALAYGADILSNGVDWTALGCVGAGLVFATTYGIAGYTLRKGRRIGAWFAIVSAVTVCAALIVSAQDFNIDAFATIILVVNLFLIGLVLANWRALSSRPVDA